MARSDSVNRAALLLSGAMSLGLAATAGASAGAADAPEILKLSGIVRDFRERSEEGGHADFERQPTNGFGMYAYMVGDDLDDDAKPVMTTTGFKIRNYWFDAQGKKITPPRDHIAARPGDTPGLTQSYQGGACTTSANFEQWFRDVPGVNLSAPLELTLVRQGESDLYVFDDKLDEHFTSLGGFFPINDELFLNSRGENKNFHFTFELETEFVFKADAGQQFTFIGDDDVWVFIDGKCVIDIGGVHSAVQQRIDLDRLEWLEDGQTYDLKFFFAERHRTQSNFRIETTLQLREIEPPVVSSLFD